MRAQQRWRRQQDGKSLRILRFVVLTILVVGVMATAGFAVISHEPAIAAITPPDPASFDADLVEQGELLAGLGNCSVCHTSEGGAAFAGGLALPTPFGVIHSTNITPDPDTGIGTWSEAAFIRAMRRGVDRDGRHLYPAFPYDYFTRVSEDDLRAIYAYLMTRDPVASQATTNGLGFPFNIRPLLAGWKLLYLEAEVFTPDPAQDEEWNRGAYLVEGLGHCGACHSPRNALGAPDLDGPEAYSGGVAEGWHVPPLNGTTMVPIPWEVDSLANYLIDGWDRDHGVAAGPMRPIVDDLYVQSEDDVVAMAVYVLSLMGEPPADFDSIVAEARLAAESLDWDHPDAPAVPADPVLAAGAAVFEAQCAECHKAAGKSVPLALTAPVNAPDPRNLIEIILHGIRPPPAGSPDRSMPARGLLVSDADMAALVAFIRDRFTDKPVWEGTPDFISAARAE